MDARSQILQTATQLFAERGFDGTSLQQIADAVGIRKPSLLYHYPSKEELRRAVLDEVLQRWNDTLPQLLMVAAAGERRFGPVIRETLGFFTADPNRARLLIREILDRPDDMKRRLESYVRPWVGVVGDLIRKGQQSGQIYEEVDPEAYVLQVVNLIISGVAVVASIGGVVLPADAPQGPPLKRHTRELVRIARFSLFCPPHEESLLPAGGDETAGQQQREQVIQAAAAKPAAGR